MKLSDFIFIEGIDFESTGFPATLCRITEVGMKRFSVDPDNNLGMGRTFNAFCFEDTYPMITEEITDLTGITQEMLDKEGIPFAMMIAQAYPDMDAIPHYFLAHNKSFDELLFKSEMRRHEEQIDPELYSRLMAVPWICSLKDIKWPSKYKCKKLSHLALDHGIMVDPSTLHRASGDVELMIALLIKAGVRFRDLVGDSKIPRVIVKAMVPSPFGPRSDGGKGKDKAKACGFGWQKAPGTDGPELKNSWLKEVKENEIAELRKELGYEIQIVEKIG